MSTGSISEPFFAGLRDRHAVPDMDATEHSGVADGELAAALDAEPPDLVVIGIKLDIPETDDSHRRVRAVLTHLRAVSSD